MRLPLSTNLRTRTGVPEGKDARLKNSYVEVRGDQTIVRKRPAAQGGVSVGSGVPQGGIGFSIGSTPYFIGFWGDTLTNYTGGGTTWAGGTGYVTGDHVSYGWVDYWFIDQYAADHNGGIDSTPPPNSPRWSRIYGGVCKSYPLLSPSINGVSTTGPFESSPSIPVSYQLSTTVIETLSCGGVLHENVLVVYSSRPITNMWKAIGAGYDPESQTGYGITQSDAGNDWYSKLTNTHFTIPYPPQTLWLAPPQNVAGEYIQYHGWGTTEGYPNGIDGGLVNSATLSQLTLYYLDATSWKYYTIT